MENLISTPAVLQENEFIRHFAGIFNRSERQINGLFESDAELIRLNEETVLAITTDAIVEEVCSGLYTDPEQIGWMSVVVNISDLTAVGARPLGILLNLTINEETNQVFMDRLREGISKACQKYDMHVWGGDTNVGGEFQIGGVGIGLIDNEYPVLTRKGMQPGDFVFSSNRFGQGGYFAFERFIKKDHSQNQFYPAPDVKKGQIIKRYGRSCIDTSDGFFAAAGNLMELNSLGFKIEQDINQLVSTDLIENLEAAGIPPWFMLAGPHGEFELLFTIKKENVQSFISAAENINWAPFLIGEVVTDPLLFFEMKGRSHSFNPAEIANLYHLCKGDVHAYIKELEIIHQSWNN